MGIRMQTRLVWTSGPGGLEDMNLENYADRETEVQRQNLLRVAWE